MNDFDSPDRPSAAGDPPPPEAAGALDRLLRRLDPQEPTEAHWAVCLLGVRSGLEMCCQSRTTDWRRRWWGALAGLAAAVVCVAALTRLYFLAMPSAIEEGPWPVVSESEVEIRRLDAGDRDSLVVGVPPLAGPLVLVAPGDVVMKAPSYELKPVDMVPTDDYTPMIVVPLAKLPNTP